MQRLVGVPGARLASAPAAASCHRCARRRRAASPGRGRRARARTAACIAAIVASSCSRMSRSASATASCGAMSVRRPAPEQRGQRVIVTGGELQRIVAARLDHRLLDAELALDRARAISTARRSRDHVAERSSQAPHRRRRILELGILHARALEEGRQQCVAAGGIRRRRHQAAAERRSAAPVAGVEVRPSGSVRGGGTGAAVGRGLGRGAGLPPAAMPSSRSLSQSSGSRSSPGMMPPGMQRHLADPGGQLERILGHRRMVRLGRSAERRLVRLRRQRIEIGGQQRRRGGTRRLG